MFSYVDQFPGKSESVQGHKFIMGNGGKGASAAVMASLMGANVKMIGQVSFNFKVYISFSRSVTTFLPILVWQC